MAQDKKPDPVTDTSKPGREEEVITNSDEQQDVSNREDQITNLPVKDEAINDEAVKKETEGERRFQEGLANNNDAKTPEK